MVKTFNFFQYGYTGLPTGVGPFTPYNPSWQSSGFAEFYTTKAILASVTSGNFSLLGDFNSPTNQVTSFTGQVVSTNIEKLNYDTSFRGGFSPFISESGFIGVSFTGGFTGDNIDNPNLISNISGLITGINIDTQTIIINFTGNALAALLDNPSISVGFQAEITGDYLDIGSLSLLFTGKFFQSKKDSVSSDFELSSITWSEGNVKISELFEERMGTQWEFSSIIWGV